MTFKEFVSQILNDLIIKITALQSRLTIRASCRLTLKHAFDET